MLRQFFICEILFSKVEVVLFCLESFFLKFDKYFSYPLCWNNQHACWESDCFTWSTFQIYSCLFKFVPCTTKVSQCLLDRFIKTTLLANLSKIFPPRKNPVAISLSSTAHVKRGLQYFKISKKFSYTSDKRSTRNLSWD